jgi:Domain of unknown function (DUF397)
MDLTGATWRKSSHSTTGNCVEVALTGATWRKSSFSGNAGNCVEVALKGALWRKASYSTSTNSVEVARTLPGELGLVAVRDSKNSDGPKLIVTATAWREFTATLRTTGNPA